MSDRPAATIHPIHDADQLLDRARESARARTRNLGKRIAADLNRLGEIVRAEAQLAEAEARVAELRGNLNAAAPRDITAQEEPADDE